MNIHIHSIGEIKYPSSIIKPLTEKFKCHQTPTEITNKILASPDPILAYKEWVLSRSRDEQREIYDDEVWDETTRYFKIIGYETYNWGKEHCEELDSFIADANEKGMKIEVFSM